MVFDTRGSVIKNKDLSQITWLRVGGPADFFFMPADTQDLIDFLKMLEPFCQPHFYSKCI